MALLVATVLAVSGCQVSRDPVPISTRQLRVTSVRRIIAQPALSPAAFSPDGRRIAFSTERAVRVADLSGSGREIAAARVARAVSWSPRLDLLAVLDGGVVWTMRADGGQRTRIDLPRFAVQAVWAPGSDRLAVVLRRSVPGGTRYELWQVNRNGGFKRLISRAPAGRAMADLHWFANSLFLLYGLASTPSGLLDEAWRVRIAYPDRRKIAVEPPARSLRLAPLTERIAYITGSRLKEGRGRIVISRLDGTGRFAVTGDDGRYTGLAWSPQGDKLAYAEVVETDSVEIWIADADRSGRLHVFSYPLELPRPNVALSLSWSPDGRSLIFGTNTGSFSGPIWLAILDRR